MKHIIDKNKAVNKPTNRAANQTATRFAGPGEAGSNPETHINTTSINSTEGTINTSSINMSFCICILAPLSIISSIYVN